MCKMHSFHGRKYQEEKSIFYSVTIKLSPLLFVTLTQHSKECWRKILDGWIDLCERKRVSQLQELLFVSLATFVSNFRGRLHSLQASPPLNCGQTLAAARWDIAVSPLRRPDTGRTGTRGRRCKQAGLSLAAP